MSQNILWNSSVVRSSHFSLSWYDKLLYPSTSLVARRCTPSNKFTCLRSFGDQTDRAYSKCGRTNAENKIRDITLRLMRPNIEFAFFAFGDICSSKVSSVFINTIKRKNLCKKNFSCILIRVWRLFLILDLHSFSKKN